MIFHTILMLAIFSPAIAFSQTEPREQDWADLVDEPSRQELLKWGSGLEPNAIPPAFTFPQDTTFDSVERVPRMNSIFGIDLSHYNRTDLPFEELKRQNIQFVYVKATQGIGHKDSSFAQFWAALDSLPPSRKVFRGAYHFLSASDDPVMQADRFVAYVNLHGGFKPGDMAPVMDLEWDKASANSPDRWQSHTPQEIVSITLSFLARVEQLTGRVPMIYSARSWWRERKIPDSEISKFARYAIWAADYSRASLKRESPASPGNAKPALWQFSESSNISKIYPEGVDANIFKGTQTDFLRTFFKRTSEQIQFPSK
jgi:lysozyme